MTLHLRGRALNDPGLSTWFNEAVTWYRGYHRKTRGWRLPDAAEIKPDIEHLSELEWSFNGKGDADVLAARPDYQESLNRLCNLVMLHGPAELLARYNGIQRHARLFAQAATDFASGDHVALIRLELRRIPSRSSAESLREFFLAALHTNIAYRGNLEAIKPDDRTIYEIHTPTRVAQRSVFDLVSAARIHRARVLNPELAKMGFLHVARNSEIELPDADEVLEDLFKLADLDPNRDNVVLHSSSCPRPEEVYLSHRKERYQQHGIAIEYAIVPRSALPTTRTNGTSLMQMRHGMIFVMRDALASLAHDLRTRIAGYLALWGYGFSITDDWNTATKLMCGHAARDGRLGELLDVFITLLPRDYVAKIMPALGSPNGVGDMRMASSFQKISVRIAVRDFKVSDIPEQYRSHVLMQGEQDSSTAQRDQLISKLLLPAVRRMMRAHAREAKLEFLEAIRNGLRPGETSQYIQDALLRLRGVMRETAAATKRRHETFLAEDVDDQVALSLDEARDYMEGLFRHIGRTRMLRRFLIEQHLPLKTAHRVTILDDLRRFIGDDVAFARYRNMIMLPLLGWVPEEELPHSSRSLVMMIRERLLDTRGGLFPPAHPLTGKAWEPAVLRRFIDTGVITFSRKYTPKQFYDDCCALLCESQSEGSFIDIPHGFAHTYGRSLEGPLNWQPSHAMQGGVFSLVNFVRTLLVEATGGQLHNPLNPRDYRRSPLRELVENGTINLSHAYTPERLREDIAELVAMHGTLVGNRDVEAMLRELDTVIESAVPQLLGWKPLGTMERGRRPLVELFREHVKREHGWLLHRKNPLNNFLRSGAHPLSRKYTAAKFKEDLLAIVTTTTTAEGKPVEMEEFERTYELYIAAILKWKDAEDMKPHFVDLVTLLRKQSLLIFNGPLPRNHPTTGKRLAMADRRFIRGDTRPDNDGSMMRFHDFLTSIMRLESNRGVITEGAQVSEGFDDAYERFIEKELRWRPVDEAPEHLRKLLRRARRHMTVILGGNFGKYHPLSGQNTYNSPIRRFIETGEMFNVRDMGVERFLELLESTVFAVGRRDDGTFYEQQPAPAAIAAMEEVRMAHAG